MIAIPQRRARPKLTKPWHIEKFAGLKVVEADNIINENQSPDMLNITLNQRGKWVKRTGYARIYTNSLGSGKINGMHWYRRLNGTTELLIAHGTKLYKKTDLTTTDQPTEIKSGLANTKATFFTLNNKAYMLNGTDFIQYDGTNVKNVADTDVAYIPTETINRKPDGSTYDVNEDANLIGAGFKDSFNGDGAATTYYLSKTGLDATAVTIVVGVTALTENTHFTVNRTNGTINFAAGTSPHGAPVPGQNNVIITAYKANTTNQAYIKKCTRFVLFGGDNDTRVFIWGNPDYPNRIWRSELTGEGIAITNPTYFPSSSYQDVGANSDKIQNCARQYDTLVIHKEFSKWQMQYVYNNGDPLFQVVPANDAIGLYAPDSLQIIQDSHFGLVQKGVYAFVGGNVRNERNVQPVSEDVDLDLLAQSSLEKAISVDFNNQYWLVVNNYAYVFDYEYKAWFKWGNIKASCFVEINNYLYMGDNTTGLVYKFKKSGETSAYSDDSTAISSYAFTKLISFNAEEFEKQVDYIFYSLNPDTKASTKVSYRTDKHPWTTLVETSVTLFGYDALDYSDFSYVSSDLPQKESEKVRNVKKIVYFQLKFENNNANESMEILSLGIKYQIQRLRR